MFTMIVLWQRQDWRLLYFAQVLITLAVVAPLVSGKVVFVKLADSSAKQTWPCGEDVTTPCATLTLALTNATENDGEPQPLTTTVLLPSNNNRTLYKEYLTNIVSVHIDARRGGQLNLNLFPSSGVPWLELNNCSHVTIDSFNLSLRGFSGSAAVYLENCYNVTVTGSVFREPGLNSHSLRIIDCWPFQLLNSNFLGGESYHRAPDTDALYNLSAVMVSHTCDPLSCTQSNSVLNRINYDCCQGRPVVSKEFPSLLIEDCHFNHLGIMPVFRTYYRKTWEGAVTIHIEVISVRSLTATIRRCNFSEIFSPYDSNVKLFLAGSTNNTVITVEDCNFERGWLYIGGALLYRTQQNALDNQLIIKGSFFSENTAYIQGGAVAMSFAAKGEYSQNEAFVQDCQFYKNRGGSQSLPGVDVVGGAVSVISGTTDTQTMDREKMFPRLAFSRCKFIGNSASCGSALFISGVFVSLTNITAVDNFDGSCISAWACGIHMSGTQVYSNNTKALNGGVITLADFSKLDFAEDINVSFIGNQAILKGGVLFADETSSTPDISSALQFATNIGRMKDCFLNTTNLTTFNYSGMSRDGKITFLNNSAGLGQDVYANSFTPCAAENSSMWPWSWIEYFMDKELRQRNSPIASGPAWIFFHNASCECLKPVPTNNHTHWLYQRKCDRESIAQLMNSSTELPSGLIERYRDDAAASFFQNPALNGASFFPSIDYLLTPWATSTYQWFYPRDASGHINKNLTFNQTVFTWMANLTLYPAPGETFSLQISLADVFFNVVPATATIKVDSGDALIRQGAYQYSQEDVVYLGSYSSIELELAGVPGTSGQLLIQTSGQIRPSSMDLRIPYRLQPCHMGFEETTYMKNRTWASMYVESFTTSLINNATEVLVCQCKTSQRGIDYCDNGKDVFLHWSYWAGDTSPLQYDPTNLSQVEMFKHLENYEGDLESRNFITDLCLQDYCSAHKKASWSFRASSPCLESQNRYGLLCSECKPGYSLTALIFPPCEQCSEHQAKVGRVTFFLGFFLYAGAILLMMTYFDLGKSAWFDAWVNYDQMCAFIARREYFFMTVSTASVPMCISPHMDALQQILLLYYAPVSLFLWVFIIFQLGRLRKVRRWMSEHSIMPTLWLALTFSYAMVIYPSFRLLSCHSFNGEKVLLTDARVKCFTGSHIPYVILAITVILLIGIAFPISLLCWRTSPRIKPLVDVYLSYVRDDRSWWIAGSVFRRLAIAGLAAFITDTITRQICLSAALYVILFLHMWLQPYRKPKDNLLEGGLLVMAGTFSMLNVVSLSDESSDFYYIIYLVVFLPTILLFGIAFFLNRGRVMQLLKDLWHCMLCRSWQQSRANATLQIDDSQSVNSANPVESTALIKGKPGGRVSRTEKLTKEDLRDPMLFDSLEESMS